MVVYAIFDCPATDDREIEDIAAELEANHGSVAQLVHALRRQRSGLMLYVRDVDAKRSVPVVLKTKKAAAG